MKFILGAVFLFLMLASLSSFAHENEMKKIDIASMECLQKEGRFLLKYIQSKDDFFSSPILPKHCIVNQNRYRVTGIRGRFSASGQCGAEPPISISVVRNGIAIVTDTAFGGNCFGGPSIAEIEIVEQKGKIGSIRLCMFKEFESPVAEGDKFEPVCKTFQGNNEISAILPINARTLNDHLLKNSIINTGN